MSDAGHCQNCGTSLGADAPRGLCPACLLKVAMGPGTNPSESHPPFVPLTVAELAPLFPQLDIIELVGRGGMGAVYKARQKVLDRFVALKILPPDVGREPSFADRFAREAKALARLNHPGIVTIYDFGRSDGLYFFLMEFVDGVNLRQLLSGQRVSPREALAIVPQICDALQYAHDQGIVHRDIKPENIMLDRRGRLKVADFGLAKLVDAEMQPGLDESSAGPDATITATGKLLGTPSYMAPEQREQPETVDHRADIYALGVVFYQMLTGELPGQPVVVPSKQVTIDVRLDDVVLRAMEKKPERRYQQASVLKSEVESIASATTPVVKPLPQPAKSRQEMWVGAICVLVVAAVVLVALWNRNNPGSPAVSGVSGSDVDSGGQGGGIGPALVAQPASISRQDGESVNFVVAAAGGGPLSELPSVESGNLVLWLRADRGVLTNTDGRVTRWKDQSEFGNDAFQKTQARQPTLVEPEALHGLPAVRFDGPNKGEGEFLHGDEPVDVPGDATAFVVFAMASSASADQCITCIGIPPRYGSVRALDDSFGELNFGSWYYDYRTRYYPPPKTWRVVSFRLQTAKAESTEAIGGVEIGEQPRVRRKINGDPGEWLDYFDDTASSSRRFHFKATGAVPPGRGYTIGGLDPATQYVLWGRWLEGDIAEFVVYRGALAENDRLSVLGYLKRKYYQINGAGMSFQWFRNGQPMDGATNAVLSIPSVQSSDGGTYSARVSGSNGTVNTSNAVLQVDVNDAEEKFDLNFPAMPLQAVITLFTWMANESVRAADRIPCTISLVAPHRMTKSEEVKFIRDALVTQAGLAIRRAGDGILTVEEIPGSKSPALAHTSLERTYIPGGAVVPQFQRLDPDGNPIDPITGRQVIRADLPNAPAQ